MKRVMSMVMAAVLSAAVLVGCGSSASKSAASNEIQAIKNRGVLKVGVKEDVPKFGFKDPATGKIDGFEVDVARAIANKLLGSPDKVELQAVNAKTRGPALDSDQLDVVVATFTVTDARKKSWNFSTPYYQDPVGLLAKNDGPKSLKDLNGKTVGVAQGSTSKAAIQDAAKQAGITVNFSEFPSYAEVKAALDAGRVDAFATDTSILLGYKDAKTNILPDHYNPQSYAVATKLSNKALAAQVDQIIQQMQQDGSLTKLKQKWGLE